MKPFKNPYFGFEKQDISLTRFQSRIATEDYNYLRSLRFSAGTVTTTINILTKKLIYALKKNGIHDISNQTDFENFVANCEITLKNESTTIDTVTPASVRGPGKSTRRTASKSGPSLD